MTTIDRPLKLGELLAETVRLYGERLWASLGLGAVVGAAVFVALLSENVAVFIIVVSLAFTAAYAAAARLASGDRFAEAWGQVVVRLPILLVLTLVVSVPFAIGRIDPLLLLLAVAWLAFTGFSIPVAMLERDPDSDTWIGRLGYALWRSVRLARVEYLHALGVAAALVIAYLLIGQLLGAALVGFAENTDLAAAILVQVVLAPFFFLGLSVLYFEQKARALSSPRQKG